MGDRVSPGIATVGSTLARRFRPVGGVLDLVRLLDSSERSMVSIVSLVGIFEAFWYGRKL